MGRQASYLVLLAEELQNYDQVDKRLGRWTQLQTTRRHGSISSTRLE